MFAVEKYPVIDSRGEFTLHLPLGWSPCFVGHHPLSGAHLWAKVEKDVETRLKRFCVTGTGDPVPANARHCGSWFNEKNIVFHLWAL